MKKEKTVFMLVFCLLFLFSFPNKILSQNSSNRGKDFWVGHQGHIDGTGSNFKLYIASTVTTSGTVSVPLQGWSVPFTVLANSFAIIPIPSATAYIGCSDCIKQKGVHVVSNDNVAAYAHIYASARSDATLMLPTGTLGVEYYATCFTQAGGEQSEFLIVATEDSTKVEITTKANTLGGNLANVPFIVTLQQGEEYQVQSNSDLTGSKIISISPDSGVFKKIAVFSGSTWTTLGCNGAGSGDNLFEEMYPVNTWGMNFISSPLKTRTGDMFRVMAGSNGTTLSINGVSHTLNQSQYFDTLLVVPGYFTADKPITLAQYARTQNCDGATGDPFMIILSPLEQAIDSVLLYSSPEENITGEYINAVVKTADVGSFLLDGSTVPFNTVPSNPIYSYSQNTVTSGSHTLISNCGMNAIAYGFGNIESYGYLAGTNIKNLELQNIVINPHPACTGSVISFTGSSSYLPISWKWYFGDSTTSALQNATHIYADTGTYEVLLVTTTCDSQEDTSSYTLHIIGSPAANFNTSAVCFGDVIPFNDNSTIGNGGNISSWSWNFGDGNTSVLQNTAHTYATCDTFSAKLVVISNTGCSDSIIKTVTVHCFPSAKFNAPPVCNNQPMLFADSSLGNISSWKWNFGDNSVANTGSSPSYTYANPGIYNVTLTVTSIYGCKDSITKPVEVFYNPVANFTLGNVCFGDTMHFTNTSSVDNSSSIAGNLWVFGDASPTSSLQNPNHYYSASGIYTVILVITTIDGCSNAFSIPVKVFDTPTSTFNLSNTCLSDSGLFTNTSLNPTMGSIANWSWDFGDGSSLNTTVWSPSHLYAIPGNYQVTLITHSSNLGCPDTLKDSITVFPMPVANFSFSNVCLNQAMNFNDSSLVSSGTITARSWNFGDGEPLSTTQNPDHTYTNSGTYLVSLAITSSNGCEDSITKSVVVHPLPIAQFSSLNSCDGNIVPFTDLSHIPATDTILSWTWNFGDGSPVYNNQNASHLYAANGSYTVQLLIVSNFGCLDSISKISIVNPNPVIHFTAIDTIGCEPLCVGFQNTSSISEGMNAGWLWTFGDGSPASILQNPTHCYTNDSVYLPNYFNVTLTVTSDSGCVGSLSKNNFIKVYPNPVAGFTVQPEIATIIDPIISITNVSTGANFWNWNFGDGSAPLSTSLSTPSGINPSPHTYADTGTYTIALITSTQFGCNDTAYQTIIIEPDFLFYIPNAFTPDGDGVNDSFSGKGIFIKEFDMSIFDRWGNLIYKTTDINKPWDGKANSTAKNTGHGNEISQRDVYIYTIKVTDIKMLVHKYKGAVTLVR